MRYAVIRGGIVENVVELDPGSGWQTPEGCTVQAIGDDNCGPGWTVDGGSFSAPPVIDPVPETITRWQGQTWLLQQELLSAVEDAVAAGGPEVRIAYECPTWYRASPLMGQFAALLGKTSGEIDAFFREASAIQ